MDSGKQTSKASNFTKWNDDFTYVFSIPVEI